MILTVQSFKTRITWSLSDCSSPCLILSAMKVTSIGKCPNGKWPPYEFSKKFKGKWPPYWNGKMTSHVNFQNCLKENDLQGPREVFTNMFPEQAKFFCATPYMSKTISIWFFPIHHSLEWWSQKNNWTSLNNDWFK